MAIVCGRCGGDLGVFKWRQLPERITDRMSQTYEASDGAPSFLVCVDCEADGLTAHLEP